MLFAQAPPSPTQTGQIFLSAEELRRFGNNAIVQVETFGVARKRSTRRTYSFVEAMGGAIEMFTPAQVAANQELAVDMMIGNPGNIERRVFAKTSTRTPAGMPPIRIKFDFDPNGVTLKAGEERVIISSQARRSCFGFLSRSAVLMLGAGLLLLARRKRS
jgi:hypothetical protein